MKNSNEIRKEFFDFWTSPPQDAKIVPNASLVPQNDPTLLFVNSGMFPLVPYLGGQPHPLGTRLCNFQRCVRTIDIEEVGDARHLVMFEMIGDWSLGDFTKEMQIPWMAELYIEKFGLDPKRLYVSVWEGDDAVERDEEAIRIWKETFKKYGIEAEFSEDIENIPANLEEAENWKYRIFPYGKDDNWWQRGPDVPGELGGPTTEIFYDLGTVQTKQDKYHINDDSDRFLEIGNSVFLEYQFSEAGQWEPMKQKNIDFGGGFERIMCAVQNKFSVYETDLFAEIIEKIEEISGKQYDPQVDDKSRQSFRVVAEHARSATFILADGITPSNKDQGYILRRLIRRMVRFAFNLGIEEDFTKVLSESVIEKMKDAYPHLLENKDKVLDEMHKEEQKFRRTLKKGLKEFNKIIENKESVEKFDGEQAFYLYETFGFPLEMTLEELEVKEEKGAKIKEQFEDAKKKHQEKSRAGAKQKFEGGLADKSEETTKLHTTQHLLLASLQKLVSPGIKQRGSNITAERLRFDFNFDRKLTEEEVKKVEDLINEKISAKLPILRVEMPKEEAEKLGAEMEFGQKYPDIVSVYFVGSQEEPFSMEFCGGPHVDNTKLLGENNRRFKIYKQENIGAGLRRIKAKLT